MNDATAKKKKISFGNTDVQVSADGKEVSIGGDFNKVMLNGIIITIPDDKASVGLQIGDILGDKTVYAGMVLHENGHELKGKRIYATPQDAKGADGKNLTMTFNEAAEYAEKLNQENYLGHNDWYVPTSKELDAIYCNKGKGALKGTFNLDASTTARFYWSSDDYDHNIGDAQAYGQQFSNGEQYIHYQGVRSSVRLVR